MMDIITDVRQHFEVIYNRANFIARNEIKATALNDFIGHLYSD